jgi:tRNA (adenine57-N1/adenine58-N1)-methyltransferase catalytic subunit
VDSSENLVPCLVTVNEENRSARPLSYVSGDNLCRVTLKPPRRGAFQAGDLVQLTDAKGKLHTITLEPGKVFHTHRGQISHDELMGCLEGSVIDGGKGTAYIAMRPTLEDFMLSMPRGAAVIYPKDAARIISMADLHPGSRVAEAGVGSGSLTCSLIKAVGSTGYVVSYERREEFAEIAKRNVARWFGSEAVPWTVEIGDFADARTSDPFDAVVLDMVAPWECLPAVERIVRPGGSCVVYVTTTTQLSRVVETMRMSGRFREPRAEESLVRTWHLDGLAVRPDHRMIGHSGFLIHTRLMAPGMSPPPRRRRPAPGAYGDDYVAPSDGVVDNGVSG